jgi:hypothetical protein
MSSTFSKNKKELAALRLVSADKAWIVDKKGNRVLSSEYNFVGKINKNVMPNVIFKANRNDSKNHFVDDTSSLPKVTKEKVVDFFLNDKTLGGGNRRVVYLVRGDSRVKNDKGDKSK